MRTGFVCRIRIGQSNDGTDMLPGLTASQKPIRDHAMKRPLQFLLMLVFVAACAPENPRIPDAVLDAHAKEYLFLELSMGLHDPAHVDAYFGPADIQDAANAARLPLDEIQTRATELQQKLAELYDKPNDLPLGDRSGEPKADPEQTARLDGLARRLHALKTRIEMKMGVRFSFDDESQRLFAAQAPDHDAAWFEAILAEIDSLLAGDGTVPERVDAFQSQFAIPADRLSAVFEAAINECRRRTLMHIELPENESFSIEYVNDKPWSGYNWYQGNAQSLIQVNTDLPIFINRAVDLGCHEGYPGHHTFNALLEEKLVRDRNWAEFSVYPLFSPQSLIAEGSGNYGIELAFPGDERTVFEKSVLFPLAGLDAAEADRYYELLGLLAKLDYAGNEAARDYLNGDIDREAAAQWLVDYALNSPDRALQRTRFFDAYRSYVVNYNLGLDLVRDYVERDSDDPDEHWRKFEKLISSPMTAADLD